MLLEQLEAPVPQAIPPEPVPVPEPAAETAPEAVPEPLPGLRGRRPSEVARAKPS